MHAPFHSRPLHNQSRCPFVLEYTCSVHVDFWTSGKRQAHKIWGPGAVVHKYRFQHWLVHCKIGKHIGHYGKDVVREISH